MKLLLILVLSLVLRENLAANDGGCTIKEFLSNNWLNGYTAAGIATSERDIETVSTFTGSLTILGVDTDFVVATIDGSNLSIKTANLNQFDEATDKQPGKDTATITATITFGCVNGNSTLTYVQIVGDMNDHPPTFAEKDGYSYNLPSNTTTNLDITTHGSDIIVTDEDFSTQSITFSIQPADIFTVETEDFGNKSYRAIVKIVDLEKLHETSDFEITATDDGAHPGPQSTTVAMKIKLAAGNGSFGSAQSHLVTILAGLFIALLIALK